MITPTSYTGLAIRYAVTMLSNSATWQAAVGAANATEALAFIIETDSGAPSDNGGNLGTGKAVDDSDIDMATAPYTIVGSDGFTNEIGGIGYWDRSGEIHLHIVIKRRIGDETPAEASDRIWDTGDNICDDIKAQAGQPGCLATIAPAVSGIFMSDEDGAHQDHAIINIAIGVQG